MKKGFLVAIILIAVLTCALAFAACAEVSTTVTYMVDGEVFKNIVVTGTGQSDPGFTPSKSGYTFDGWYTDEALYTPFDFEAYAANKERTNIAVYAKWEVNTYNITYENTKGAANSNPATYNIETAITLSELTSPGYTFEGWFAGEENIESIELGSYGDLTLTAKWTPIDYNITYANTLDAENSNPATYNIETAITLSELTSPGYTFEGWFVGEEKVESIKLGSYGDITLTARWTLTQYTATFVNSDGTVGTVGFDIEDTALSEPAVPQRTGYTGEWEDYEIKAEDLTINAVYTPITYDITYENTKGAANDNPATYNIETAITLADITSPGYTFEGWFAGEEKVESIELGSYGDITLTARWTLTQYTATFVNSDGTVGTVDFDIEDTALSEPAVPQRTGYTGAWEDYEIKAEDLTINAVYTPITYNITYENTKGAANGNPATYNIETAITLSELTSPGYTFEGWFVGEEKVESIELGSYGDITLTAKWAVITYTATFVNSDGTVGTVDFDIEDTALSEPAVPQRTGYTGEWEDYEIKAEDLTINAVYTPITYNITYENTKGAANNNPATYNIETATITLSDITSPGYTFEGWYTDETFEEQVNFISEGSFGDLELFAKWTPTEYSVNYVLDGGINNSANPSSYSVVTLGGADGVIPLEDPTKYTIFSVNADGTFTCHAYKFLGWYKDSGFEQRVSELSLALGSVTLYAKWAADMSTEVSVNYVRVNENNELDEDGGYILFGQYPQTIKAANVSIISTTPDTDGYYLGSNGERYAKVVADPYMDPFNRGYTFSNNSSVIDGNTYYFKVEPIRWRILSESDGNALILCDSIIANHYYHHTSSSTTIDGQKVYANNYKYSDIRAWLNDEFYNTAFGDLQQALIQTTEVDNSAASTANSSNGYACENTFDKVFLPSYREVITIEYGFESSPTYYDTARQMLTSDFSRATGAIMSTDLIYYGNGSWWLRSPEDYFSDSALRVYNTGDAYYRNDVNYGRLGVVPALKLTLS